MGEDANKVEVYGPNAAVLDYDKIFELKVVNWDAGKHPLYVELTHHSLTEDRGC
jgi:hypothetical protein